MATLGSGMKALGAKLGMTPVAPMAAPKLGSGRQWHIRQPKGAVNRIRLPGLPKKTPIRGHLLH